MAESTKKQETTGEIVRTIVYALLIALAFRVLFFQPFSIPSSSMKSTLLIGDYLFVSKYAYGYSNDSIPFSPNWIKGRVWSAEPERGDVIVFRNARDGNKDYIKRLVGLPGDTIKVNRGVLHINGSPVKLERIEDFVEPIEPPRSVCVRYREVLGFPLICEQRVERAASQACTRRERRGDEQVCIKEQYLETLPNGEVHRILNSDNNLSGVDNTGTYTVRPGHYFFMGDNRDNSGDSRSSKVEQVPFEDLLGRAEVIFLSSEASALQFWKWRMGRFFTSIE